MVIEAVRAAFVRRAAAEAVSPMSLQLLFNEPRGDCHIKAGHFEGDDRFVVKIATGFYDNPKHGLPVNEGLMLVFDARTGRPEALLRDRGWLTAWRTAAAGALAAEIGCRSKATVLGIVGTGHQARLQAEWVARHLDIAPIRVFGRSADKARSLAADLSDLGFDAEVSPSIDALCGDCRLIVTCTPATKFVIGARNVRPGTHIVALGADSPGKQELDPQLFVRAGRVIVDDRMQCANHGDLHHAIAAGLIDTRDTILLGDALAHRHAQIDNAEMISVVDLTGTASQDVAIAALALDALSGVLA